MSGSDHRNVDPNIIKLGWVSFFTDFASAIITPLLPIFVVIILDAGADKLGIIIGVSAFVSYFLRLLSGYISDRYQIVKPLVVFGYLLSALTKPLFGISQSWGQVALLKSTERLGKALRSAPKDVLIKSFAIKGQMGKSFGLHKTLDIAGELSGAIFVFVVMLMLGTSEDIIRQLFFFTAIPGAIALLILVFGVKDRDRKPKPESGTESATEKAERHWSSSQKNRIFRIERSLLPTMLAYFAMTLFVFDESFYLLRSQQLHFELAWLPLLLIVSKLVQTLTSLRIGLLVDKVGARKVLSRAYMMACVTGLLFLLPWNWAVWFGFGFLGLYTVMSLNAMRALIATEASYAGSSYGFFYAGTAVSAATGAMVTGALWQWLGSQNTLAISVAGMLLVTALVLVAELVRESVK